MSSKVQRSDTPQWQTSVVPVPQPKRRFSLPFDDTGQGVSCSRTERDGEWWCYVTVGGGVFVVADEGAIKLCALQHAERLLTSALETVRLAAVELEEMQGGDDADH